LCFVFCSLFGIGVIFPATQAGVSQSFKRNIGLLSGLFYSIEMLFGAICSYILSFFGSATWSVTSALMLVLAFCIVFLTISDRCFSLYFQNKQFKNI
jgi:DHA1 family bicyclomycin/chloramphenicol resistance-like MFS transporter